MVRILMAGLSVGCLLAASCAAARPARVDGQAATGGIQTSQTGGQAAGTVDLTTAYHPYAEFEAQLHELAAQAGAAASLESLCKTAGGRDVWLLTLADADDTPAEKRQALLIVGGIDADHPASSETAFNVAQRLVAALSDDSEGEERPEPDPVAMLQERTIYIVPRANPDGIETYFESIQRGERLNARPVDDDRDGVVNEDGANDLNGDGLITVMRVPDPQGEWMPDSDEPRLLKKADAAKGERGLYKLMLEGIDDDADGQINEDGPGGVDDDRNWPHFYERNDPVTGLHQLSEPQTRALAQFVVDHPRIAAAIVYGRHDNLVNVPKGQERGPDGESYRDLHPDDVAIYEHISEKFKEITELKGSHGADAAGALYAWLYSQRGIPTFATSLWWPVKKKEEPTTQPASQPTSQPTSAPAGDPEPQDAQKPDGAAAAPHPTGEPAPSVRMQIRGGGTPPSREQMQAMMQRMRQRGGGSRGRRQVVRVGGAPDSEDGDAADEEDEAADTALSARVASGETLKQWLTYSDEERDHEGFVEWSAYEHPTLGKVEIGGLAPYFDTTPPADELETIAERQTKFLIELAAMLPTPRFGDLKVENVGADVWQIELTLVNDKYLPTHTGIAKHTRQPPIAVRPLVDAERIVGGKRLERVANLAGSGGAAKLRWLIRGKTGDSVRFRAFNRTYGELLIDVKLNEAPSTQESE